MEGGVCVLGGEISNSQVGLPSLVPQDTSSLQKLRSKCLGANLLVVLTMQELGGGGGGRGGGTEGAGGGGGGGRLP